MCCDKNPNPQGLLARLKTDKQPEDTINEIKKEIKILGTAYFYSGTGRGFDYKFTCIKNYYEYEAEETGKTIEQKLLLYEQMYLEIVEYLLDSAESESLENMHYPECQGADAEVTWQTEEEILEENTDEPLF